MPIGASGEDVDLFLEEELWIDVKLRDSDLQQLAQLLETQRQQQLQLRQLHAADPAAHPLPATPPPSAVPVTPASLRRWHEAEVRSVQQRSIRVHFLNIPLPAQWINVDEGWERLSELHVMTEREREGLAGDGPAGGMVGGGGGAGRVRGEELDLTVTVDVDEVFEEVVLKARLVAFLGAELRNGERVEYEERLAQAKAEFIRRWFTSCSSSSSSSSSASASSGALAIAGLDEELELTDSDDVVSESVTIPLFDPLTHCRLIVPVRTAACTHCQCSDLMTHIQQQKAKLDWTCLCGKEAYANQLQVDLFLFAVLQAVQQGDGRAVNKTISHEFGAVSETRHVVINRNGSWRVDDRAERDRRKRKRAAIESSAAVSQPPTSSSASSSVSSSLLGVVSSSPSSAVSSASASSSSSSSFFSCPFPVELRTVVSDDIEYVDVRDDQPSDADILAWLMRHVEVKLEKLASDRAKRQKQPIEESKSPFSPPPSHPSFMPFMSPSGAQRYPSARPSAVGSRLTTTVSNGPFAQSPHSMPASHPRLLSSYTAPSASSSSTMVQPSPSSSQSSHVPSARPHHTSARHRTTQSRRSASVVTVPAAAAPQPLPAAAEPLNINTCTEWQLRRAGLSAGVCEKVIGARRERGDVGFERLEELQEIKGIGVKTYAKLIEKVVI